jgi:hypothetical protein
MVSVCMLTKKIKFRNMKFLKLLIVLVFFYNFGGSTSSSSSGGDLNNITYPYHLPETCRWQAYELQRDGNDTVLYIASTKLLVKDLSIKNKTLRLVDPDIAVWDCSLPTLPRRVSYYDNNIFNLYYSLTSSLFTSEISFFNCTEEIEDLSYKLINCTIGPWSSSRVYAAQTYSSVDSIPKSCRYVGTTLTTYLTSWDDIDGAHLMQILRQGFVANWITTDDYDLASLQYNKMCSPLQFCWSYVTR